MRTTRLLSLALLLLVAACSPTTYHGGNPYFNYRNEEAPQVTAIETIDLKGYLVLDVRSVKELRVQALPGATKIQYGPDTWGNRLALLEDDEDFVRRVTFLVEGDKSRKLLVVCLQGVRATWAVWLLRRQGFDNALAVSDGLTGNKMGNGLLAVIDFIDWLPHPVN